jgi:lysozyme
MDLNSLISWARTSRDHGGSHAKSTGYDERGNPRVSGSEFIKYAEHGRTDDGVGFLLYGGIKSFTDTSKHPNRAMKAWGRTSTAAGAYQILYGSWKEAREKGIVLDFSPNAQDRFTPWKLTTRHAISFVRTGDIDKAIPLLLRSEWTSMPGASQSKISMAEAHGVFDRYAAELSPS